METEIKTLGNPEYNSPLSLSIEDGDCIANFKEDHERIIVDHRIEMMNVGEEELPSFEVAGPRSRIFFKPEQSRAAIVTCGGLCPGLNDVIRALVMELYYHYGVREILGVRYGFRGMTTRYGGTAIPLKPDIVSKIHHEGGSYLGSSRGPQSVYEIVDFLQRRQVNMLFIIGGDGTIRGAIDIIEECLRRDLQISVVGVPKTIDNDIGFIDRSFGFSTAFTKAREILECAHVEAQGAFNGIGLVKVMGRHSGYIATRSALACGDANFVLIPEVPFDLDGDNGFLVHLENRLLKRHHALVVVAEGAGQKLLEKDLDTPDRDKSGNIKLGDFGIFLRKKIIEYMKSREIEFTLKYIDPSYIIRSARANAEDNVYCSELAQCAVHAAFSGKTRMIVGTWHNEFVHIPMDLVVEKRRFVNPDGPEWLAVMESTGQPHLMVNTHD